MTRTVSIAGDVVTITGPLAERLTLEADRSGLTSEEVLDRAIQTWVDAGKYASKFWLTAEEAVDYSGFRAPEYVNPYMAFYRWVERTAIPKGYAGGVSLRFKRADLDRALRGRS